MAAANEDVLDIEASAEDRFEETMDDAEDTANNTNPNAKRKGRGFKSQSNSHYTLSATGDASPDAPQRSVEGWIVIARNIHEEAAEEDVLDKFSEYGDVRNLHLNLDRRTGYVKGYALIEYDSKEEALAAVEKGSGEDLLGQTLSVDWAFVHGKKSIHKR
ncbi:uncharacterized protein MONBRDRAFT_27383 [Monosiga brevicollis MX1]|uniref:RRM domain-containing protein n=1 Tax=Monosiga brevicollis TaxID=81824 RepID=A9V546_MONBE|nr:uncharacterized protein MONBRDRAFT_27383 [Monosiga brevicollis MX1]EDQ87211.1 predicted protein [Monosiga brevicollis MX1]|eukprot:XP_001747824.1 hypothetical protein [Monosiga brevicollis MX1]